ncbi:unnamed protein product, partial [Allacma fusca]
ATDTEIKIQQHSARQ